MTKKLKKITSILSVIAAVLLLATLVTQFLPFWSAGEDEASISGYLWFPEHYKDLTSYFKDFFKDNFNDLKFSMNIIYLTPLVILASCLLGIALCFIKRGSFVSFILPAIGGIYGASGYLQNFLFQMGQNWQLHAALCIAAAAVGCIGLVISAIRFFLPIES